MKFRPCIDIHNGAVKQIVGETLKDHGDIADTNFISTYGADYYAQLYRKDGLKGGHIILLNTQDSQFYGATKKQAVQALKAYPGGLQIGGGITNLNAGEYLAAGASHVIVTSYVFQEGAVKWDALEQLSREVGKEHLVLDLSCRKKNREYFIVTNRWQKYTTLKISHELLTKLSAYCDEFLVHGVDVEGKAKGVEKDLAALLGEWDGIPITYAGGIGNMEDIEEFKRISRGKLDITIGSALDLFGGNISYAAIKSL